MRGHWMLLQWEKMHASASEGEIKNYHKAGLVKSCWGDSREINRTVIKKITTVDSESEANFPPHAQWISLMATVKI